MRRGVVQHGRDTALQFPGSGWLVGPYRGQGAHHVRAGDVGHGQIAQRRVSVDEATAAAAFVEGDEGAEREERLGYLYEAVLAQLNRERGAVIAGIGRYARHQAALSDQVEQEQLELTKLEGGKADPARLEELRQKLAWDTRIFRERAQSLTYVCETPVLLERRAFELARALAGLI